MVEVVAVVEGVFLALHNTIKKKKVNIVKKLSLAIVVWNHYVIMKHTFANIFRAYI